jgi:transposase
VRNTSVWQRLLGLARTVVEGVDLDEAADALVVSVRPQKGARRRCGRCGRRAPLYDRGEGRRRWRALDVGQLRCFLEADAPRVSCPEHGPTVSEVPWARHGAGHTFSFDDQVAWLATHTSKSAVVDLMRVAWRTVGSIIARVVADGAAAQDPFDALVRIGIDEISYRRGHKYLTVVVDHDSGRLVWAAAGKERATLEAFFEALGEERCDRIRLISADGAPYIASAVRQYCPFATLCADPFHVVAWASAALDEVRREVWNEMRRAGGDKAGARALRGCRYALWKNPENLTARQRAKLAWVAKTNNRLYRAYLLKEQLRQVFHLDANDAKAMLGHWLAWASRCRIPAFVDLADKVAAHRDSIHASLDNHLSNGLVESTNTKIRLLTRVAFGFASPDALIALALLDRGGYCPALPGRTA